MPENGVFPPAGLPDIRHPTGSLAGDPVGKAGRYWAMNVPPLVGAEAMAFPARSVPLAIEMVEAPALGGMKE